MKPSDAELKTPQWFREFLDGCDKPKLTAAEAVTAFRVANGMKPDTIGAFTMYGHELVCFATYILANYGNQK